MTKTDKLTTAISCTVLALFTPLLTNAQPAPISSNQPAFIPLGDLDGGTFFSAASGISGDGTIVTGTSSSTDGQLPYIWTQVGGINDLINGDALGIRAANGSAISADGSVIVGTINDGIPRGAFKWTSLDGIESIGDLPGYAIDSRANAVSADGSTIVGRGYSFIGLEATRWTEATGMVSLGGYPHPQSVANGVSDDGTVITGYSSFIDGQQAFRWTASDGLVGLGGLNTESIKNSIGYGISGDGNYIVGISKSEAGNEAFRWNETDGMIGLGDFEGGKFYSVANAVSADGSVVVGSGSDDEGELAFRWTEETGMQSIVDWLAESNVAVEEGFSLRKATDVSDDGNTVVGNGLSTRGFEAWLARGESGAITIDEFTQTFGTTASIPQTSLALPSTILNGAHHHVLLTQDFVDQDQMAWVTGDFANHSDRDADIIVGEVGMAYDFKPGLRGGIAVGHGEVDQDLTFDGKHELDGQYLLAEIGYQIPDTRLIVSLTGIYGNWDADIERGYLNAGLPDISQGDTDVETLTARLRVDWVDAFALGDWSFTPRAAFSVTKIDTDSYTETGGGFPVQFDSMSHTAEEIRIGLTGETALNEKTTLRGILEGVHRMDKDDDGFSGQVIGLFAFDLDGADTDQTWARAGAEISHRLRENLLITGTLFGATQGEDPVVTASLNLQFVF